MGKINGKVISFVIWLVIIGLLVYSRFINLGWGLPYPMHPDERNMATAIQQLNCQPPIFELNLPRSMSGNWEPITSWLKIIKPFDLLNCFNPGFFAYGQFSLYLGYLISYFLKFFDGDMGFPISFQEGAIALRVISALASIISVFVLLKIIRLFDKHRSNLLNYPLYALMFILTPFAIQFAHFGTTESLLMLFYSLIIYLSMQILERRTTYAVVWLALVSGLAVATKVSSIIFLAVPFITLISHLRQDFGGQAKINSKFKTFNFVIGFILCTLIFALVFSPHNFINFKDFIGSMNYESEVALGKTMVFYTRQFVDTVPILFQLVKVFPYSLGLPLGILGGLGILGLGWKDKKINLLRFAFLIYFLTTAFMFAKWSRFMAPVFPIVIIFAVLLILKIKDQISKLSSKSKVLSFILSFVLCTLIFAMIIPGLAYLSVYQNSDVRFQASEWIYKNIPNNSYILSETANVVDVPFSNGTMKQLNNYNVISFNFYNLDEDPLLQSELKEHLDKADYIFIPSRRIFANYSKEKYPILDKYYIDLFNGRLGFKKVAEFESFPKICLPLTDKCFSFNDEQSEETWTVFDHPVIRIYKKVK